MRIFLVLVQEMTNLRHADSLQVDSAVLHAFVDGLHAVGLPKLFGDVLLCRREREERLAVDRE